MNKTNSYQRHHTIMSLNTNTKDPLFLQCNSRWRATPQRTSG